jgi:hypothetical protein
LSDPLVPPDLRGWFDRVSGVVRRSMVPLLIIQLGVAAVSAVVSFVLNPALAAAPTAQPGSVNSLLLVIGLVIALAVGVFAQGASIYVAVQDASGREATVNQALRFASGRAPALIGWGLVAGALTFLGFVMLVVPGIYLALVFAATLAGVVTIERGTLARCFELVNRRLWPTVGRMAIAAAGGILYSVVSGFVVRALTEQGSLNEAIVQALCAVPVGVVAVGVAVVTYAELRFHETGQAFTDTLVAELNR